MIESWKSNAMWSWTNIAPVVGIHDVAGLLMDLSDPIRKLRRVGHRGCKMQKNYVLFLALFSIYAQAGLGERIKIWCRAALEEMLIKENAGTDNAN